MAADSEPAGAVPHSTFDTILTLDFGYVALSKWVLGKYAVTKLDLLDQLAVHTPVSHS